jgi:hypothetical protein
MKYIFTPLLVGIVAVISVTAEAGPYGAGNFKGRIAYSADGNFNDPDDWAASPMVLAILAECGIKERLVHFDYNCIMNGNDPKWEATHAANLLGAADRYGFDRARFHDCQKNLESALSSLARAINDSTANDPLYFIVAGPMEVPLLGIQRSDPAKRKHVYCISHSRWNDGFSSKHTFTNDKRSVVATGINWVQIRDQNRLLSTSPYGKVADSDEYWRPWHWMRDSDDAKVRFLWNCMQVSTRPDPSDAGMAYFLTTGDEEADPAKLKQLLDDNRPPAPLARRPQIRLEAENFRDFNHYQLEDRNDRAASHRLQASLANTDQGSIATNFAEPYAAERARYDVEVRYFDEPEKKCRFVLKVNGSVQGAPWESTGTDHGWATHTISGVEIAIGDRIQIDADGATGRLDYVQFNLQSDDKAR